MVMNDDKIFAFVLMPFDAKFDDFYKFGIKEPASELDIMAERVDEQLYREGILERIYTQIITADIIIADMSGQNPNVFYEVGYAHAKDKLCILLTASAHDIPFDLKHRRHVVYGISIETLRRQMLGELAWAKQEIENVRKSRIKVSLRDHGNILHKTNWSATAEVSFKADLHNDSDRPSAEIEGAYFYTGERWDLYQDGRECPSTDSDVMPVKKRHFLTLPVRSFIENHGLR